MKLKEHFNKLTLCKWRLIQLVIKLTPNSVKEHGIVVYVKKT